MQFSMSTPCSNMGRRAVAVLILYLCTRQMRVVKLAPPAVLPRGKSSDFHWEEGRVGTRARLERPEKRKITFPYQESISGRPAPSPVTILTAPSKICVTKVRPLSSVIFILRNIMNCSPNDTLSQFQKNWNNKNTTVSTWNLTWSVYPLYCLKWSVTRLKFQNCLLNLCNVSVLDVPSIICIFFPFASQYGTQW